MASTTAQTVQQTHIDQLFSRHHSFATARGHGVTLGANEAISEAASANLPAISTLYDQLMNPPTEGPANQPPKTIKDKATTFNWTTLITAMSTILAGILPSGSLMSSLLSMISELLPMFLPTS